MNWFWRILLLYVFSFGSSSAWAKITLQPHQQYAVDYLHKHPQQKGLLLYHALGSGKTYLSIAFAESYPEKAVLVVLPRFLKSNWLTQLQSYGVKNPQRYELIALEDAWQSLKDRDLSKSVLIVDEVHKLVNQIRYASSSEGEKYSLLYSRFRSAEKILLLTGTPIFSNASDIAYIANLFSEVDQFPYNSEQFRQQYLVVKPQTSLWRGYFLESKLVMGYFPLWMALAASFTLITAGSPILAPLVAATGGIIVPQMGEWFPVHTISFREFRADLMADFAKNYVSFYALEAESLKDYPQKEIIANTSPYTIEQTGFFLDFADEDLDDSELNLLLADSHASYSSEYLRLNSHLVQRDFLRDETAGRQIGNLALKNTQGALVESNKFMEILEKIQAESGRIAVYSNYYHNGILQFGEFLKRHGFADQYVILHPELSIEEQTSRLAEYNSGKKRIILIHPEITEGISLLETEQFHILEPVANIALLDQVIGRAVRFQSHAKLPVERRRVKIYLWEATINYRFMSAASRLRRSHWQRRYAEVNPNLWTKGILELDTNFFRKDEAPDARVKRNQDLVSADMRSFENLIKEYSIEK